MSIKALGDKLKTLRLEKGLSLAKVGKAINMSHNFLSEVENGKKVPSAETLRALAKLYEYDEDELFRLGDKLPLRTIEYLEEDVYLQKLLSEVQKKYADSPEKIDVIHNKILKLYQDFINSED